MDADDSELFEDFVCDIAALTYRAIQPGEHLLFIRDVIVALFQELENFLRILLFLFNLKRLQVLRHDLLHRRPRQVPIEEVLHVVLGHAVSFDLHLRSIDLLLNIFRNVSLDDIYDLQFILLLVLVTTFFGLPALPCFSFGLLHFDLLNDTWRLLCEFLLDIDITPVTFIQLAVNHFLELIPRLLSHKIRIEGLMDQLVPLQPLQDHLRVKIFMIRRQVAVSGVVDPWSLPRLPIWHQRYRLAARGRPIVKDSTAAEWCTAVVPGCLLLVQVHIMLSLLVAIVLHHDQLGPSLVLLLSSIHDRVFFCAWCSSRILLQYGLAALVGGYRRVENVLLVAAFEKFTVIVYGRV